MQAPAPESERVVLPLQTEAVTTSRNQIAGSVVRVATVTREHEHFIDEELSHEHVEIERVPIGRQVDAIPPVREEGSTTVLPVMEEVIERRLILKEEIRVTRVRSTEHHRERVVLRKQDAVITRTEAGPETGGNRCPSGPAHPPSLRSSRND
jgi:stress response protein YsnF